MMARMEWITTWIQFENMAAWTFFKYSSSARKSLKFCRNVVAVPNSFKKFLSITLFRVYPVCIR